MNMSIEVTQNGSMDEVIGKVTDALKEEGFGVLTRIDVDTTLKTKIGADFRPYVILGACNPGLAHQALSARPDVGLLLPCNVVVEETGKDECLVRFIDPEQMMGFGDLASDETLVRVGGEAAERINRAAASLN